ncbi:uncharacterized protein [Watersipora subatra]|uniref:uncharacterized protein n=1 Tax=Watersipora subatra TaxID=2589382 RepID=UPI00355BED6F
MEVYAQRQREELYGEQRKREGEKMKQKLTASHVLRDGEFNINKRSDRPGFQWSTVTLDDYRRALPAKEQGKQYDESYKQATGSDIPIFHEGIPLDTYTQTSMKGAYVDKGTSQKREYIGNNPATNWPDMTPKLVKGHRLGHSEYSDIFTPKEVDLSKPKYAKVRTAEVKLPIPLNETKHKISVNLGCELAPTGGVESEVRSRFLQTKPKRYDGTGIRKMKEEMEWNSKVFKEGDYNEKDGIKQTMFDIDFGKKPKGNTAPAVSSGDAEAQLNATIQEKLHFMPKLIESSMLRDTARQDGDEGKKYHTRAHFKLGSHADKSMTVYDKDFPPFKSVTKPERTKPADTKMLNSTEAKYFNTTNRIDYYGTEGSAICSDNKAIRQSNMEKQSSKNINFVNTDDTNMQSVFTRDYPGPPKAYATMKPATEKKCEFDFLVSNGMIPDYKKLTDKTENNDNFKGSVGASVLVLNSDKARIKSAAKRRLKSGKRAHFILGSSAPSYKTVSNETFMGRAREDANVMAAGKVEKPSKDFSHFSMSENTEDMVADPDAPTIQESRTAIDNYSERQRVGDLSTDLTVTRRDFLPIEERRYTVPQIKQMKAVSIRESKATAKTHLFHTDTSSRNNYETTAMASFIKPEEMSGKVHLSSLQ